MAGGGQESSEARKDSSSSNVKAKKSPPFVSDVEKLALFPTEAAASPLMTHEELAPILENLGFMPGRILEPNPLHGAVSWQTYTYTANSIWMTKLKNQAEEPPTVKLPYPEIDGLHEMTYSAFLHAIDFYLDVGNNISSILHVRSTEGRRDDIGRGWRFQYSDKGEPRYIYRPTTLDRTALDLILKNQQRNRQYLNRARGNDDHHRHHDHHHHRRHDHDDADDDANTRYKTRRSSGSSSSSSSAVNVPLKHIITNLK